jgi:hypothetical protein
MFSWRRHGAKIYKEVLHDKILTTINKTINNVPRSNKMLTIKLKNDLTLKN